MKYVLHISEIYGVLNWEVIDLCKQYGPCKVNIKNRNAFCYVEYENEKDGEEALKDLNGQAFGHSKLKVKIHRKIFEKKICFNFQKDGHCRFGSDCKFDHPEAPKEVAKTKVEKIETKKEKKVYKPEADYFRRALMVVGNLDPEEKTKIKKESKKP